MAFTLLPQSPTPLPGRRLFELLEEPQEPFSPEKRHSPKLTLPSTYSKASCKRLQNWIQMQLKSISSWVGKPPFNAGSSTEKSIISPRVLELFNELFELAYTPAFHQLLGSPKCKFDRTKKKKFHESSHEYCFRHEQTEETIREMTASEVSSFLKMRSEVGEEVEDEIFEEIKEETIIEIIFLAK